MWKSQSQFVTFDLNFLSDQSFLLSAISSSPLGMVNAA
jgi:hypothetical protein